MAGRNAPGMHRGRNSSDLKSVHGDVRMRDAYQGTAERVKPKELQNASGTRGNSMESGAIRWNRSR